MPIRRHFISAILLLLLGLAYWPGSSAVASHSSILDRIEYWFFDSQGSSAGLVAAVAAWMVWRRRTVLYLEKDGHSPIITAALFSLALGALIWARLNEAPDLLFVSLAFLLAAVAFHGSGLEGIRAMTLPMVVLVFALPLPSPLSNEILWTLQNWSAAWTADLLNLAGVGIGQSGAHLTRGDVHFLVIEGCSGLRSILTLTLVSLVIRELLGLRGLRGALVILLAPPLAMALNIVRIAAIVLGSPPTEQHAGDTHLGQGILVLAIGTVALFVVGHFLAARESEGVRTTDSIQTDRKGVPTKPLALMVALLLLASFVTRPWPPPDRSGPSRTTRLDLPFHHGGWAGRALELDYPFLGLLPRGRIIRRFYQPNERRDKIGAPTVEVLIATDSDSLPRGSPVSSKLMVPGRDWQIDRSTVRTNWILGREIRILHVSSTDRRALVYAWSVHDEGLWWDSLRSLLALERGPFARSRTRYMIELAAEIGDESEAEVHARQILDRFVYDFNDVFRAF